MIIVIHSTFIGQNQTFMRQISNNFPSLDATYGNDIRRALDEAILFDLGTIHWLSN